MNIEKYWNPENTSTMNISLEDLRKLKPSVRVHPLNKLRQVLKQQIYPGLFILVISLVLIIVFNHALLTYLLLAFCAYAVYFLIRSFMILNGISQLLNQPNENILGKMKVQGALIKDYVKLSEILAAFLYPISIVAGMLITFLLIGEESPENLFKDSFLIYLSIAAIAVFVPLQYLFTRKMNKKAFGSHLEYLKEMTETLDNEIDS
jgi:hypothetical protein